jgi:hypothetical protein
MIRAITKTEVTPEQFEEFLAKKPHVKFDGVRYTEPVQMRGLIWNKPVACTRRGKCYLIERRG